MEAEILSNTAILRGMEDTKRKLTLTTGDLEQSPISPADHGQCYITSYTVKR
jgi:hypothetical protein